MPINKDEIIKLAKIVAEEKQMKVTVKESAKGAAIVGSSAFVGGLVGGPPGLAIGGIFGSIVSYVYGRDRYRSVVDVIQYDMTPGQQQLLVRSIENVIHDLNVTDLQYLLLMINTEAAIMDLVMNELKQFLMTEMNLSIAN